jgi:hypothetical protein
MPITQMPCAQAMLFAAIFVVGVAASSPVFADERLCSQLRADFASAPAPGGSPEYRKYSRAVNAQREQIMIARRQARDIGCGFYAEAGGPGCVPINLKIERMERNLAGLQRRRAELAREEGRRLDRSRILAALNANNCGDPRLAREEIRQPQAQPVPLEPNRLHGSMEIVAEPAQVQEENWDRAPSRHDGESGGPAKNFTIIAGNPPDSDTLAKPAVPKPPAAMEYTVPARAGDGSPGEDEPALLSEIQDAPSSSIANPVVPPERAANLPAQPMAGKPDAPLEAKQEPAAAPPPSPEAVPHDPGQRKVRVVGPTFLPDPQGAIDLRAPVRKLAR